MICPACKSDKVAKSRAKAATDKVAKFLVPLSFYRCKACGWRGGRLNLTPTRRQEWVKRVINSIGVVLLVLLLIGVVAALAIFGKSPQ